MSTAPADTPASDVVLVYRRTLAELSGEQREAACEALGFEPPSDDLEKVIDAIVARVAEPGAIQEALGSPEAFELFLRLLELGDYHPVRVMQLAVFGQDKDVHAELVGKLIALGFIMLTASDDEQIVVFQPWLRVLLGDEIRAVSEEIRAREVSRISESVPAHHRLVLCANYLRGASFRLTTKGEIYQRDRDRAEALFDTSGPETDFDSCLRSIQRLECLMYSGNQVLLDAKRAESLFSSTGTEIGVKLLVEDRWEASLDFAILESLVGSLCDGLPWMPYGLLAIDVVLYLAPRPSFGYMNSIERLRRELLKLQVLGFVAVAEGDKKTDRYGRVAITAMGLEVFESLTGEKHGLSAPVGAEHTDGRAIFQPSLDVLVPVDAPTWVHWRVGAVARLESIDSMCRYAIDKDWAQCVFGRESTGGRDAWIEKLVAASVHEIPENVTRTLESWLGAQGRVRVSKGIVIALDDDAGDAARSALADAAKKLRATRVTPTVYVVETSKKTVANVSASLEQLGLKVDGVDEDGEGGPTRFRRSRGGSTVQAVAELLERAQLERDAFDDLIEKIDPVAELRRESDASASPNESRRGGNGVDDGVDDDVDDDEENVIVVRFGDWIDRDGVDRTELDDVTVSSTIHEAVRERRAIQFIVDHPEESIWTIIPSEVVKRGSGVYVSGFCPDTAEHRVFPLSGIVRVRSSEEPCL